MRCPFLYITVRPWDARFLGKEKTRAAQNSCNFFYLIGWRQDHQKTVLLKVLIHKFVQLKCFWTQFKNVHLQGPCSLRPCISRPYCISLCPLSYFKHLLIYRPSYGLVLLGLDAQYQICGGYHLLVTWQYRYSATALASRGVHGSW